MRVVPSSLGEVFLTFAAVSTVLMIEKAAFALLGG